MHVYKKPSGKWAYKIDIGKNPLTGKRQQKEKGGFARAKDAKIAGEKMLQQLRSKVFSRPESITFGDFAAEWLEAYKTLVKISTVRIREHQLLNLKRFFDKIPLQQIGKKQYQDALLALSKDFSPNTISGIHATARMIFRRAKNMILSLQIQPNTPRSPDRKEKSWIQIPRSLPILRKINCSPFSLSPKRMAIHQTTNFFRFYLIQVSESVKRWP